MHPKHEISALLQRDIVNEVRDSGVRVLKTDVAWVGAGYSFGLNGVAAVSYTHLDEDNIINDITPAWVRKPADMTDEDYKKFYRDLYPMSEEPLRCV